MYNTIRNLLKDRQTDRQTDNVFLFGVVYKKYINIYPNKLKI